MAMVYTLVTSAKEWLSEKFAEDDGTDNAEEDSAVKDDKGAAPVAEGSDEDEEDVDFDDDDDDDNDDFEDDEDDMLEHYVAEKSDSSAPSSRRGN